MHATTAGITFLEQSPHASIAPTYEPISSRFRRIKQDYDYQAVNESYPEARQWLDRVHDESNGKEVADFIVGHLSATRSIKKFGHLVMYAFEEDTVARLQEYDAQVDGAAGERALFNGGTYAAAVAQNLIGYAERQPAKHFLATKLWRDAWLPFTKNASVEPTVKKLVTGGVSHALKQEITKRAPWHDDMTMSAYAGLRAAIYAREVLQAQKRGISAPLDIVQVEAPFTLPAMVK